MEAQKFAPDEYGKLPHLPGVYRFFDTTNTIIYVGKAKDLSKRVSSYFTKSTDLNRKTRKLVSEVYSIEIVIVNSEFDALLLENSLIKEFQPRYNILLKDDKSFPSICITNERFPRIYSTRQIDHSLGLYYGPYTSVKAMNGVLDLLRKLYKIRTCNLALSEKNIQAGKFKICLEYHIGNCLGPCEGHQNHDDYLDEIENAKHILKGNIHTVKVKYKELMNNAAQQMKFEAAQDFKTKLELLEKFQSKTLIVNQNIEDTDVFGVITSENHLYINYLKIQNGSIRVSETVEAKRRIEEPEEEILQLVAFHLRDKYSSTSTEILSNKEISEWEDVSISIPKIGDKKKLIDLSLKNAAFFRTEKEKQKLNKTPPNQNTLEILQKDLNLEKIPNHIECFDNSNIQGTNPVSSMVCFKQGKPSKKDYRHYNIKTVEGPNDFASMKEVVGRRYTKLKNEGSAFPDLIVIDGGKGQLSSACEVLKQLNLYGQIPIIGIAKRLEEIYVPEDSIPIHISKKSPSLKLLQHLRDEAHRFAITFHRLKRSQNSFVSILDEIEGIGEINKNKLLQTFGSAKGIFAASQEELERIVGKHKAQLIINEIKNRKD